MSDILNNDKLIHINNIKKHVVIYDFKFNITFLKTQKDLFLKLSIISYDISIHDKPKVMERF